MTKFGIGQAVRRVEDGRFTTGTGQYVGDVALARHNAMAWRFFRRTPMPASSGSTRLRQKRRPALFAC